MSNQTPLSSDPSMDYSKPLPMASEGTIARNVGNALIFGSLIGALVCVLMLARTGPDGAGWNGLLVSIYVASGINGAFFGYLLAKVGSVLKRLEAMQPEENK